MFVLFTEKYSPNSTVETKKQNTSITPAHHSMLYTRKMVAVKTG